MTFFKLLALVCATSCILANHAEANQVAAHIDPSRPELRKQIHNERREREREIKQLTQDAITQQKKLKDRTPDVIFEIYQGSRNRFVDNLNTFDREYREFLTLLKNSGEKTSLPETILAENLRNQRLRFIYGPEGKRYQDYLGFYPELNSILEQIRVAKAQKLPTDALDKQRKSAKAPTGIFEIQEMLATQATMDHHDPAVRYATELVRLSKKALEDRIAKKTPEFDITTEGGRESLRLKALAAMQATYEKTTSYNMYVSRYNGQPMGDMVSAADAMQRLRETLPLVTGQTLDTSMRPFQLVPVTPDSNLTRIANISNYILNQNNGAPLQQWRTDDAIQRRTE